MWEDDIFPSQPNTPSSYGEDASLRRNTFEERKTSFSRGAPVSLLLDFQVHKAVKALKNTWLFTPKANISSLVSKEKQDSIRTMMSLKGTSSGRQLTVRVRSETQYRTSTLNISATGRITKCSLCGEINKNAKCEHFFFALLELDRLEMTRFVERSLNAVDYDYNKPFVFPVLEGKRKVFPVHVEEVNSEASDVLQRKCLLSEYYNVANVTWDFDSGFASVEHARGCQPVTYVDVHISEDVFVCTSSECNQEQMCRHIKETLLNAAKHDILQKRCMSTVEHFDNKPRKEIEVLFNYKQVLLFQYSKNKELDPCSISFKTGAFVCLHTVCVRHNTHMCNHVRATIKHMLIRGIYRDVAEMTARYWDWREEGHEQGGVKFSDDEDSFINPSTNSSSADDCADNDENEASLPMERFKQLFYDPAN